MRNYVYSLLILSLFSFVAYTLSQCPNGMCQPRRGYRQNQQEQRRPRDLKRDGKGPNQDGRGPQNTNLGRSRTCPYCR